LNTSPLNFHQLEPYQEVEMKVQMRKPAIMIAIGALALPLGIALAQDESAPATTQSEEQAQTVDPAATPMKCPRPSPHRSPAPIQSPAPQADVTVSMRNMRFNPDPITIRVGQTVKWINESNAPHTVTDDPCEAQSQGSAVLPAGADPFDSGILSHGKSYTKTFTVPGTYKYFCKLHEKSGMVGTITVNP
jgi:plastocyanin